MNMLMHILSQYALESFFLIMTLPTRIQPPSFSLIDNILTNDIDKTNNYTSGLLVNDLSDHKIIFTIKISHI